MNANELRFEHALSHMRELGFTDQEVDAAMSFLDGETGFLHNVLPTSIRAARLGDPEQVEAYYEKMNEKHGDMYTDAFDKVVYVTPKGEPWKVLIVGWHRHQ
jgi:hypothetical protein